ncbi:PucR family transcriptional regulator [Nocardiopsis ansamitocini]|uniref:PucR family transcriptional regulator n=1 Tax=Nocardiopsis ansamitocini TaxID=1670832 RepID=A0A9W6UL81_9ACTN|nr:PucR family transcriptional regulator [Nocardiopsis ansamitocini]GLU49820.1 PucR family transcriptional regulator [Nocardiopsis ansamitocini]
MPHTIPLRSIIGRRDLALRVLVPGFDDETGIRWSVVSEISDPVPYLLGGELLLTAGVNLATDVDEVDRYVSGLVGAGVAAVGFGVTPVHDRVPTRLVECCRARGMPLVEVPRETPFVAISQAVGAALEEVHLTGLRRLDNAHRALTTAAIGVDAVDTILTTLGQSLGCWGALIGDRLLGHTGSVPPLSEEATRLIGRLRPARGPRSAKLRMPPDELFLHVVGEGPGIRRVLVVGRARPLDPTDRAVLGTAVALLGLLAHPEQADSADIGRLAVRLLLQPVGDVPLLPLLRELTGESGADAFRVVRARWAGRGLPDHPALLHTRLVDVREDDRGLPVVCAVLADRGTRSRNLTLLRELRAAGWLAGLSGPVGIEDLPHADRQASALLIRAEAARRPQLPDEAPDPMGDVLGTDQARSAARALLGPLAEEGESARTLRTTLRVWLANHGGWDRTAAVLGAHRNSVRYRIGRIERDLGVDLADPEQRMRLWFALSRFPSG